MNKKIGLILLMSTLLAGCATNKNIYDWGDYEKTLFTVYHEPAAKEKALERYIKFVETRNQRRPLAPGLFAEAGTFLLEQGDIEGAVEFYKLEHDAWPESRPMLATLIDNLEARK